MISKKYTGESLLKFQEDIGSPKNIIVYGSGENKGNNSELYQRFRKINIYLKSTEPYTPKHNIS